MKRTSWTARTDRDTAAILKGRALHEAQADLRRFDHWPETHRAWLLFLAKQSYHRERMASSAAYSERYRAACEKAGL